MLSDKVKNKLKNHNDQKITKNIAKKRNKDLKKQYFWIPLYFLLTKKCVNKPTNNQKMPLTL